MDVSSLAQVRSGIATRIVEMGDPWTEAQVPYERLGASGSPDQADTVAHGAFAVGVPKTDSFADRQTSDGAIGTTQLVVRFLARAKPSASAMKAAEDAALDLEHTLIKRMMARVAASSSGPAWPGKLLVSLVLVSRAHACPPPHDWFVHDVTFKATHRLALA